MRALINAFVALLVAENPTSTAASEIYDTATLQGAQARYERTTRKIMVEVIVPALLSQERRDLGRLPRVEFPLRADAPLTDHPLAFYAANEDPRIVMPIASLKFLDDLCTAYAWLQLNNYSIETVTDYTALLRYKDFRGRRPPLPLIALQVPRNALDDRRVDELALGHFVTARAFILAHELGHMLFRHSPLTYAQSRANEQQADRFAAEVMRRVGLPPLGMLVFFFADASWAGYPSQEEDTHPLSGDRLRALAQHVDDASMAEKLRLIGQMLDDPDIRTGLAASGRAMDEAALAPRRSGQLLRAAAANSSAAFSGLYRGASTQFADPGSEFPVELALERNGNRVRGRYSFGMGVGTIEGETDLDRLIFDWAWAGNYGRGVLRTSDGGRSFTGTWGYKDSVDNAGRWSGKRAP
jgi:hypothetical protein